MTRLQITCVCDPEPSRVWSDAAILFSGKSSYKSLSYDAEQRGFVQHAHTQRENVKFEKCPFSCFACNALKLHRVVSRQNIDYAAPTVCL